MKTRSMASLALLAGAAIGARNSADYKAARKIGDKYAKFRAFAIEGLPK